MKRGRCIDFISFDVARCNKKGQVLNKLEQIGFRVVQKHGWFQVGHSETSRTALVFPCFEIARNQEKFFIGCVRTVLFDG